jgi:hypothetical protein
MKTLLLQCVAASFLLPIAAPPAAAQTRLRWRLDQGQQLRVRVSQTIRTEMRAGEKPATMTVLAAMEMRWRVDRVDDDGTLHLSQAFSRLILRSAPADGPEVAYDSASTEPPPRALSEIAAAVQPLLASRFTVAMSPRGEFSTVQPSDASDDRLHQPTAGAWAGLLSPSGMERTLRQCLGLLPDRPVEPGDTWQHRDQFDAPQGPVRIVSTYRYQGTTMVDDRPLEVIRMETDSTLGPPPGAFDEPVQRQQTHTGTYHFDASAGHLVRSHIVQSMTSEVASGDQPIRVTASSTLVTNIAIFDF